jgi:O-antigen/teichoic acid export membrane protein
VTKEYFKKGLILYFFGNLSSKIITLLLLPLFTFYLSQEEYGLFDILNTIVMFFVPIVGVQLFEGILRFLLDTSNKKKQKEIITTSAYFLAVNLILLNIFFLGITSFVKIPHSIWVVLYFNFYFVNFYLQRVARGLQLQKQFALSGIFNTVTIAAASLILLVFFKFKTDGLLIAYFSGSLVSAFYLLYTTKIWRYIETISFSKKLLNQLVIYSVPLLFDAVLWWTMNLSDRLILGHLSGTADVGIYSVANKFAAMLTFINHIFYLVWQEYAIIKSKGIGNEEEFQNIFLQYLKIQFTGVLFLMPVSKLAVELFIDPKFIASYLYIPPLLAGSMFSAFAAFYGLFYQIEKNTKGALYTSMLAGIINIVSNFVLIPIYGIWAAAGSTLISFLILWLIRIFILKNYISTKVLFTPRLLAAILLLIVGLGLYYSSGYFYLIINLLFGGILFIYLNKSLILNLISKKKID